MSITRSVVRPVARPTPRGVTEGIGGLSDPFGPELVTNGDFSDGATGWTVWTNFVDGKAVFDGVRSDLIQAISVETGKTYQISWYQSGANVYYRIGGSGNLGFESGAGVKVVQAVSPGTTGLVLAQDGMTTDVDYIDDVSVREVLNP